MNVGKYAKTVVAALFAAVVVAKSAVTDGVVTPQEWIDITLAVLTSLGVWAVPNARQSEILPR
jgi:5-enolpyruvylshikimate-3-phosphate synthase